MSITSDKACEHAKSRDGQRTDYPVAGANGLALRVTADGNKTWALRYYRAADGKRRRLTLGSYPAMSLKDARLRARQALNAIADGRDPAGEKQDRRNGDTFEGLARQWIEFKRRQDRADSYLVRSELRLKNIPGWFRELKFAEIQRVNVTAALDEIAKRGAKTETNRYQALISAVLKWAMSEGLLDRDASAGVKRRFEEAPRERVLSDDETRKLWDGLGTIRATESARIAMKLCIVLGQRPKEIATLRKDRLALDALHPTATVERTTSKNRVEHVVPLPKLAVELLQQARDLYPLSAFVFPDRAGMVLDHRTRGLSAQRIGRHEPERTDAPLNPNRFSKIVERARAKDGSLFGIADVQLYDRPSRRSLAMLASPISSSGCFSTI
jgi:integrase